MLSLKHNFVFIHIPKTGGNSIQTILEPFTEDRRLKAVPDHDLTNRFAVYGPITNRKHCTSAEYIERLGLEKFMALKRVTFVRNPLDRALSWYFSPHRWVHKMSYGQLPPFKMDKKEFGRLLEKMTSASSFLQDGPTSIPFDFVGRYENFEADVRKMLEVCGLPPHPGEVPHFNQGYPDKRRFCDREIIRIVRKKFEEDYANFNYDPD